MVGLVCPFRSVCTAERNTGSVCIASYGEERLDDVDSTVSSVCVERAKRNGEGNLSGVDAESKRGKALKGRRKEEKEEDRPRTVWFIEERCSGGKLQSYGRKTVEDSSELESDRKLQRPCLK